MIVLYWPMTKTLVVFRSIIDFIYLMHAFLQFGLAYVAPESRVVGAGELVDHPKKIALNYIKGYFLIDIFVVLPLPQVYICLIQIRYLCIFCFPLLCCPFSHPFYSSPI